MMDEVNSFDIAQFQFLNVYSSLYQKTYTKWKLTKVLIQNFTIMLSGSGGLFTVVCFTVLWCIPRSFVPFFIYFTLYFVKCTRCSCLHMHLWTCKFLKWEFLSINNVYKQKIYEALKRSVNKLLIFQYEYRIDDSWLSCCYFCRLRDTVWGVRERTCLWSFNAGPDVHGPSCLL